MSINLQLETPSLLLREFQNSDKVAFAAYRSDPVTAKYQSWDTPYSEAQAAAFIESLQHLTSSILGEWYQLAIELKSTRQIIGDCAFCILAEDKKQGERRRALRSKLVSAAYSLDSDSMSNFNDLVPVHY